MATSMSLPKTGGFAWLPPYQNKELIYECVE